MQRLEIPIKAYWLFLFHIIAFYDFLVYEVSIVIVQKTEPSYKVYTMNTFA